MKFFIIGGTGFLGSHLIPKLLDKKYEVVSLTRDVKKAQQLLFYNQVQWIQGDLADIDQFMHEIPPVDVIIMIAMPRIFPGRKIAQKQVEKLSESIGVNFINSLKISVRLRVPIILSSSTNYKTSNSEIADETCSIYNTEISKLGQDTESIIEKAVETGKPEIIRIIPGHIYGNGGTFKKNIYDRIKKAKYKIYGTGNNYIPRIHVDDLADAYIKAAEILPIGEKFIIADDTACTVKDFCNELAKQLKTKTPRSIPGFLAKWLMGSSIYEIVTLNSKVSNQKAKQILGWKPVYPSYKEGLKAVVQQIEGEKMKN